MSATPPVHWEDLYEIGLIKARYFRLVDLKDWAALQRLFTPDAVFHHPAIGELHISQAVAALSLRLPAEITTIHHGYMSEIQFPPLQVDGAEKQAIGIWAMSSLSFRSVEGEPATAKDGKTQKTMGEYTDTFRKTKRGWKIEKLVLRSTYREDVGLLEPSLSKP